MITETQIKSLFREQRIASIAKKMQTITFREGKPLYTLRMTPEQIAIYVRFGCIERNGRFAKLRAEWFDKQRNKWQRTDGLQLITDDEGKTYTMPKYKADKYENEREYINKWISWAVLDREEFMNNNSAMAIYI